MLGAIIGDIVGSSLEGKSWKGEDVFQIGPNHTFTDDTILTLAVAKWLLLDKKHSQEGLVGWMQILGNKYIDHGFSSTFYYWLLSDRMEPYESKGNGSAMRVSPVGLYASSLDEALELARISAEVTHNSEEGICGAQAIASCVYLAKHGYSKEYIRGYIEGKFDYNLSFSINSIKDTYRHSWECSGTVPQAICSFLDSYTFKEAISLAVSLGGDTDTLGAMAASIAATFYDIPAELKEQCYTLLPKDLQDINDEFVQLIKQRDSSISPNKAIGSPLNYYKVENSIYAGEYPYAVNPMLGIKKLDVLNDLKVNTIIDLTENGELYQYTASIRANCTHYRFPIKDRNIPDSFDNVYNLMAYIDNAKSENGTIYIHCWGGVGRTGTIVACWLVYNGMSANEALAHLNELWKSCPKSRRRPYCPDHGCQIDFIKQFEIYIKNSKIDGQKNM